MTHRLNIKQAADRLEKLRELPCAGDGQVDDMMLAGELARLFEGALLMHALQGEAMEVMRLRVHMAAIDAVDLVSEDFNRRGNLA